MLLATLFTGALGGAFTTKVLNGPIQTLDDFWFINFGHNLSEKAEMIRAKQEANIQKYKNSILENVESIPEDHVQEPKLSILGPALEASRYYIDDTVLRNLFSKVVAGAFDDRLNTKIRTAFIQFIKEMDTIDAKNLQLFSNQPSLPIAEIQWLKNDESYSTKATNVFLGDPSFTDSENSSSIDNLARLSLVNINFGKSLTNIDYNDLFKKTSSYQESFNWLNGIKNELNVSLDNINKIPMELLPDSKRTSLETSKKKLETTIEIYKNNRIGIGQGTVELTQLGKDFCNVCIKADL